MNYVTKPKSADREVLKIFAKIERGLALRAEQEEIWDYVERFEDLYQWGGKDLVKGCQDEVTVNKISSYIRNYRAEVAYNDPRVKLSPKSASGWQAREFPVVGDNGQPLKDGAGRIVTKKVVPAKAREALINESILAPPDQNLQQTSGLLTKAGVTATGWIKTTYEPMFTTPRERGGKQYIPVKNGGLDLSGFARNPVDGSLIEGEDTPLVDRRDIPAWEDFRVQWVPYKNMIVDPDGGAYTDDHSWICEEEVLPLEEVKAEELYENTKDLSESGTRESLVPGDRSDSEGTQWSDAGADPRDYEKERVIRIFHFFDIDEQRYIVLADGHKKKLRDVPWDEIGIVDHPYEDYRPSLGTSGDWYQRPVVADLIPLAQMYNVLTQMELRAAQNSTRKVFAREGALDTAAMEALQNSTDLEVVWIDERKWPKGAPLSSVVEAYQPPNVSATILAAKQSLARDFDEIGGMTGESQGQARADSATQSQILDSYNKGRIGHDRKILAECWRRLFKKLNDLLDRNMTQPRAVRIQGADGNAFTVLVDPDMILGDFDVSVDFQELAPPNTAMQNAGKMQLLQVAGQNPWMFSREELVREFVEPYGIKSENFIKAMVEQAQMQMQMLQLASQKVPEAGAPTSEGQALAQNGAGSQVPRTQGAT